MPLDIPALRRATPALPGITHFNAASTGLVPRMVADRMQAHLALELAGAPHEAGLAVAEEVELARAQAARLIGAAPHEIAFTTGAADGWNAAFAALAPLRPGDRVLVGGSEWGGNVLTLARACARAGARLERIPDLADGRMDLSGLPAMLDERVRLIAVTWIGAHLGLAHPVARVGQVARAHGVPVFVDAAQALGVLPVDVAALGCDVLVAPGRKALRGPRGTGLLYMREAALDQFSPVALNIRSACFAANEVVPRRDAARFEAAEHAPALRLGLGAALQLANELGAGAIADRVLDRTGALRRALETLPGIALRETGPAESHVTTFTHPAIDAPCLRQELAHRGVTVAAVGKDYAPFSGLAMPRGGVCRASVSYLTSDDEIARLCDALADILSGLPARDPDHSQAGRSGA